ncbi:Mannan endo-1,6-alpha-mannosidase [Pleurostoma richardsiae]|uniref:Mannan endo-1,6-alpha-mannosidase n=1 Tax=Pleurostoma richardsiae TaxID=41990 RepID=A0AA38VSU3_9PEZI|nr:Mannan endo-1,6-alpha-mannosidase [Pleurostoma richardsiae]
MFLSSLFGALTLSIRYAASIVAYDLLTFYHGNESGMTPGILPGPPPDGDYYWWQGGAMWGTLVDYYHYTGDPTYVNTTKESLLFQTGPENNYMPPNWTASLGNDDQAFWALSAMLAAETRFPDPPEDDARQWLALAQAVFNTQAHPDRHDDTCNGGLRWQIPMSNNGYNYKNSIANGCFFNIGARLARYTDNETYAGWAHETYDWLKSVRYIDDEYNVYDGAHVDHNCTDINKAQFSYNAAILLQGAAFMYNYTSGSGNDTEDAAFWEAEVRGLLNGTLRVFFPDGIAFEVACEQGMSCTSDMLSFKGYLHRWMAVTAQLAPFAWDTIMPVLRTSAEAAARSCAGGDNQRMCGFQWSRASEIGWDGTSGAGQQMNVLGALSSLLANFDPISEGESGGSSGPPITNSTGGTSGGNAAAGYDDARSWAHDPEPITNADRVGAGILTAVTIASVLSGCVWLSVDETRSLSSLFSRS